MARRVSCSRAACFSSACTGGDW